MAKYVEFPLEGGGTILIEVADEPARSPSGFMRTGSGEGGGEGPSKAQTTFDASVESISRSADLLVTKLRGLSAPPDELEINFNLKAAGEMGSLAVSKAGSEANFAVSLKWRTDKPHANDKPRGEREDGEHAGGPAEADARAHAERLKRRGLPAETPEMPDLDDDDDQDDDDS